MYRCPRCGFEDLDRTLLSLTPRQRAVLAEVVTFLETRPMAPSIRDIMNGLGLKSVGSVHKTISALVKRGWLIRYPGAARALALSEHAKAALGQSAPVKRPSQAA